MTTGHFSRELYDRLGSSCGPVISRLRYTDPTKYTPSKEKTLVFLYEYLVLSEGAYNTTVVLRSKATHKEYSLPVKMASNLSGCSPGTSCGGDGGAILPRDLPKGKYQVYFQLTENGRVVSRGHYFETEL